MHVAGRIRHPAQSRQTSRLVLLYQGSLGLSSKESMHLASTLVVLAVVIVQGEDVDRIQTSFH